MGHEVYSLASFLEYHLKDYKDIDYEIVGFDIDPDSIKKAKIGIYNLEEIKNIPKIYISKIDEKYRG